MATGSEGAFGLEITELRLGLGLGLPGDSKSSEEKSSSCSGAGRKRGFSEVGGGEVSDDESSTGNEKGSKNAVVVGWPPVCSYRQKNCSQDKNKKAQVCSKLYVKVRLDGAPFLRKIDLNACKDYSDLSAAIAKLFGCFGIDLNGRKDSDYVPIYEDKDGDWMLVGDVPWRLFAESCKRLRIMKSSEATGFGFQSRIAGACSEGPTSE